MTLTIFGYFARVASSGSAVTTCQPCSRMCATTSSCRRAAGVSFTRRMSISAVAVAGMIVRASPPTNALDRPRTLSDGYCSASCSFRPGRSGPAMPNSVCSAAGSSGTPSRIACSSARQRRQSLVEPLDEHLAIVVLHRREQLREAHRRVRHPVAVVTAVQRELRPERRELQRARCRARRRRSSAARSDATGRRG